MTAHTEYTEEEWELLRLTPYLAGMAVVFVDHSGVIETVREGIAMVVAEAGGPQHYPGNELIAALMSERSTAAEQSAARKELEGMPPDEVPGHVRKGALEDCRRVVSLLAERSSAAEREGYVHWVMDVARATAVAARNGGLFSRGPLVDDRERALLADIAEALGTDIGELPGETR